MRISLLMQREPFGDILTQTLESFFSGHFNHPCTITWSENDRMRPHTPDTQVWICNPYLNVIFIPGVDTDILEPVLREFSYSTIKWRRPLQRFYCTLATGNYTAHWLSKIRVRISPPLPRGNELLIVGGNHRIRILDRNSGLSYVLNKQGFNPKEIENEIAFRSRYPGLPTPELIHTAEDGSWFSERYIAATPINRLLDDRHAKQILDKAVPAIQQLSEATSQEIALSAYSQTLHKEIIEKINSNHLMSPVEKEQLATRCAEIMSWLERIDDSGSVNITTSQTHGDFQPANILADDDKVWLIDWEYTKRRQSVYDGLVFALGSRYSKGLSERIGEELEKPYSDILINWPTLGWGDSARRKIAVALFLLEELNLYLSENDNQLFSRLSGGMRQFMDELELCIQQL
jgi:hypothetical protein